MKTSTYSAIPGISAAKPDTGLWSGAARGWSGTAFDKLAQWYDRATQRRQLNELNDRLLADIGVTRIDACHESRKHFWQA
jgi:uncharacterized protein YjiS (DUF1127 family)